MLFPKTLQTLETVGIYKGIEDLAIKLGVMFLIFLSPLCGLLKTLMLLVGIDLATGLIAAVKRKQKITSAKLSRTIVKILIYLLTISIVHLVSSDVLLDNNIPLTSIVACFMMLTEVQSIFENLNKIHRHHIFTFLIDKISTITKGRTIRSNKYKKNKH